MSNLNEVEQQILCALIDLETVVQSIPSRESGPELLRAFARLDALTEQLPPRTDATLLHYLHRKSYEKARSHLQERARGFVGNSAS